MTVEKVDSPVTADDTLSKNESERMTCQDLGLIFAREYYTFLNKKPSRLHGFYGADSVFVRGEEAESVPTLKGQEEIRKKIEELNFDNCKVLVTQVDSQMSANDGILISVLGEISNKDMPSQKFAETFFLAPQTNGYYVLNNIFRFLKDKVEVNYYSCDEDGETKKEVINHLASETVDKEQKEIISQTPSLPTPPPLNEVQETKLLRNKELIETENLDDEKVTPEDKAVIDNKKPIEDKILTKEKKLDDSKSVNNKSTKMAEPLTTKKEKGVAKNNSVHNKKVEEQTNSLSSNGREQTSRTNNETIINSTKDHNNKSNHKIGVSKHVYNNNTASNTSDDNIKSWAKLAAPAPFIEPGSGQLESAKPFATNNNHPHRAQMSQATYSPKINVQSRTPDQQHLNMPYNYQTQLGNIQQYPHQQQQPIQNYHQHQHVKEQHPQYQSQIFVKNVNASMTEIQLGEAFSKFGPIKSVTIGGNRNCAFIEYGSVESTQKALEQHKVMIGGNQQVYAEERRPPRYNRQQIDNNNNRRYPHNRRGGSGSSNRGGAGASPLDKRGGNSGQK